MDKHHTQKNPAQRTNAGRAKAHAARGERRGTTKWGGDCEHCIHTCGTRRFRERTSFIMDSDATSPIANLCTTRELCESGRLSINVCSFVSTLDNFRINRDIDRAAGPAERAAALERRGVDISRHSCYIFCSCLRNVCGRFSQLWPYFFTVKRAQISTGDSASGGLLNSHTAFGWDGAFVRFPLVHGRGGHTQNARQ